MSCKVFSKAEDLVEHTKEYVNTRIRIVKLDVAEKTSGIVANLAAGAIVAVVFLLALIFGSIAGAYAFAEWIGKPYAGFLIVAGIYFLLGIVVWKMRERFIRIPVMNAILRQLFKEDDHEKN